MFEGCGPRLDTFGCGKHYLPYGTFLPLADLIAGGRPSVTKCWGDREESGFCLK